jgi:dsRNA-specific ribonuclease
MQLNNERLESYGDSLMTLMVILELYLTRDKAYMENDLDGIRKSRTSNDILMLINITNKIHEHMQVEPYAHQHAMSLRLSESSGS